MGFGSRNRALAVSCYGNRNEHLSDVTNKHPTACDSANGASLAGKKLRQPERADTGISTLDPSWEAPLGVERTLPAPIANFFLCQIS